MTGYRTIDHQEALQLLETGAATVIDVRTPGEYERLGHIPGAWLLPVDLMAAPAVLPADRGPLLVYCEHGVRTDCQRHFGRGPGRLRRAARCHRGGGQLGSD